MSAPVDQAGKFYFPGNHSQEVGPSVISPKYPTGVLKLFSIKSIKLVLFMSINTRCKDEEEKKENIGDKSKSWALCRIPHIAPGQTDTP